MPREEVLRRLTAALLAAGLLGAGGEAVAQPRPEPVPVSLYAVAPDPVEPPKPSPPASNAPSLDDLEARVDEVLTWADSPEGQAEQRRDPTFRKLLHELRAVKASIQRRRAK